jgi:hypothetical protein
MIRTKKTLTGFGSPRLKISRCTMASISAFFDRRMCGYSFSVPAARMPSILALFMAYCLSASCHKS